MRSHLLCPHWIVSRLTFGFAMGVLSTLPAMAQEGQDQVLEEETPRDKEPIERIQVTGSRLKRTQVEGASPVILLDQEAIDQSGVSSVSEALQNMTVSAEGSYGTATTNDTRGTVTNVNLRGLGPENTLVLLDGRRLPDEGGEGIVDLSTIPLAAVERIEVLKDSASALYGSDAIGGVINIITKQDFEGAAFSLRAASPSEKGGAQTVYSFTSGVTKENFRSLTTLSYRQVEPVYYRDRAWTREGLSFYAFPANIGSRELELQAHPNCPDTAARVNSENGQSLCAYNYGATSAFSPESTQISLLNNFDYQVSDTLALYTSLRIVQSTNRWSMAPNAGKFIIPAAVANQRGRALKLDQLGLSSVTSDIEVYYRSVPWGLRTWNEDNTTIGGTIGLRGRFADFWEWTASVGQTEARKDSVNTQGFLLKNELVNAIARGDFNPFELDIGNPALAAVVNRAAYKPFVFTKTRMTTYDAQVRGDLFELPAGYTGLVLGFSRSEQDYSKSVDPQSEINNVFGVTDDKGDRGSREVNALYVELGLPLDDSIELALAVRHDQYDDFGVTTNPKLSVSYRPLPSLLLRANTATGFKAPTLKDIYRGKSVGLVTVKDRILYGAGDDIPVTSEVEVETTGNKELEEETSFSYNLGLVSEPLDRLTLTVDYWFTRIDNIVTTMEAQDAIDALAAGSELRDVSIKRSGDNPDGRLERISIPTLNLGRSEDAGYDLMGNYRWKQGAYRLTLGSEYSRKLYARQMRYPGLPDRDTLGQRGQPRWRMVNSGSISWNAQSLFLRNNIISKQQSALDPRLEIGSFTTFDLQFAWNHPWNGSIAIGALNLFDTDFPVDASQREGDDRRVKELYSSDGRILYVNINQVF